MYIALPFKKSCVLIQTHTCTTCKYTEAVTNLAGIHTHKEVTIQNGYERDINELYASIRSQHSGVYYLLSSMATDWDEEKTPAKYSTVTSF